MSRRKFKQACKAFAHYPPEEDSLSLEALRFQRWVDQQPEWIIKRSEETYDLYSELFSGIDLDLHVKEALEMWLIRQIKEVR